MNINNLYTDKFIPEKELVSPFFFKIAENFRNLGINLIKDMEDIYDENCKTLKKEIQEDIERFRNLPCTHIGRNNIFHEETVGNHKKNSKSSRIQNL